MNCPACGVVLPEGTYKCFHCGVNIDIDGNISADSNLLSWLGEKYQEHKMLIIAFVVLCAVTLPCAFCVGYRAQWILWQLGLH